MICVAWRTRCVIVCVCGTKIIVPKYQYCLGTRKFMIASQSCGREFYRVLYHFSTTLD